MGVYSQNSSHCTTASVQFVLFIKKPPRRAALKGYRMGNNKYEYIRKTEIFEGKRYEGKGKTEAEAYRKLHAKIEAAKRGETVDSSSPTVKTYCQFWLETYKAPKVREPGTKKEPGTMSRKSYQMYEDKINGYIIPAIGSMRLKDVEDVHLQQILNKEKGMSKSHVMKLRMVMKSVFGQAHQSRKILFDPSTRLTLPVYTEGKHRSITPYERKVLLKVAQTHRCGLWVRFLLGTGVRPGETPPLLVGDLDFKKKLVTINKSLESGAYVVGDPKTDRGIRKVPIPADLLPDLKAYVKGKKKTDYVFPQTDGKRMMSQTCLTNNWRSFTREMDLAMGAETTAHGHIYDPKDLKPDGTPLYPDPKDKTKPRNGHKLAEDFDLYNLRHTFATDLKNAGVHITSAKYILGHEDISTTGNIYTHEDENDAVKAAPIYDFYIKKITLT